MLRPRRLPQDLVDGELTVHAHGHPAPHRRRRAAAVAVGGSAVVAGALLGSAYLVGSGAGSASVEAADGTSTLRAGWDAVAPSTPTSLDGHELDTLRAGGWYGPELESLGYRLRSAEGIMVDGRPTLELTLENDGVTATVYEQRKVGDERGAAGAPVSAVSGRPVTADGFEHVGGAGRDLWVRSGEPWQVVLDSPAVTYTVVSAMPAAAMPRTLSQLMTTERAQLSMAPRGQDDSPVRRIVRGFSRIAHPEEASR